jgi:hypothetical protein
MPVIFTQWIAITEDKFTNFVIFCIPNSTYVLAINIIEARDTRLDSRDYIKYVLNILYCIYEIIVTYNQILKRLDFTYSLNLKQSYSCLTFNFIINNKEEKFRKTIVKNM